MLDRPFAHLTNEKLEAEFKRVTREAHRREREAEIDDRQRNEGANEGDQQTADREVGCVAPCWAVSLGRHRER